MKKNIIALFFINNQRVGKTIRNIINVKEKDKIT